MVQGVKNPIFQRYLVIEARNAANLESGSAESELPSYTIASGLPTYEEALEQLKQVKELSGYNVKTLETMENRTTHNTQTTPTVTTLSVINLFQFHKNNGSAPSIKTS
ncbi:hypothetical protein NQ315_004708 [Exocentrus adspersus]|uniref:Uncharacterized protein n=1 Tax=Exocentrus adspersus TaxID=1586481 RepID=A0AAV8W280_9CUCU|nr:hypothetical protein NQ315_004708 [Exocentrus adspersus]